MEAASQRSQPACLLEYLFGLWIPNCVCKTWKNLTAVQGKAMKMMKGQFALIYEDTLSECNMNKCPK